MMKKPQVLLVCLLMLAGLPAHAAPQDVADDLGRIVNWLTGNYSNEQQIAAGQLNAKSDLLFPVFARVDIPAFGTHVIYLQWPIGAPDGKLQRQRIWAFEEDATGTGIRMRFYTLKEPERWVDAHVQPDKVKNMTLDDAIGYPETCYLPVSVTPEKITASIPTSCEIISSRRGTPMSLEADIMITADTVSYQEGGAQPDGTRIFDVPATGSYMFRRIPD